MMSLGDGGESAALHGTVEPPRSMFCFGRTRCCNLTCSPGMPISILQNLLHFVSIRCGSAVRGEFNLIHKFSDSDSYFVLDHTFLRSIQYFNTVDNYSSVARLQNKPTRISMVQSEMTIRDAGLVSICKQNGIVAVLFKVAFASTLSACQVSR